MGPEPIPRKLMDRKKKDRQTLFYRTLPAEAGGPTTSLQEMTGGNRPNLVVKRMLRYFLKLPPLERILQFYD